MEQIRSNLNHSMSNSSPILMDCYICSSSYHSMTNCPTISYDRSKIQFKLSIDERKLNERMAFRRKRPKSRFVCWDEREELTNFQKLDEDEEDNSSGSQNVFDLDNMIASNESSHKMLFRSPSISRTTLDLSKIDIDDIGRDEFLFLLTFEKMESFYFFNPQDNPQNIIPRSRIRLESMVMNVVHNYHKEKAKRKEKIIELMTPRNINSRGGRGSSLRIKNGDSESLFRFSKVHLKDGIPSNSIPDSPSKR